MAAPCPSGTEAEARGIVLISRSMPSVGLEGCDGVALENCDCDKENGEESQENQLDDCVGVDVGFCVGAICEEVQSALVFLIASTVDVEDEANGLSFGRLFFSHASRVL